MTSTNSSRPHPDDADVRTEPDIGVVLSTLLAGNTDRTVSEREIGALYDRLLRICAAALRRYPPCDLEAGDVAHEVLLRLSPAAVEARVDDVGAWLFTIACRTIIDRSRRLQEKIEGEPSAQPASSPNKKRKSRYVADPTDASALEPDVYGTSALSRDLPVDVDSGRQLLRRDLASSLLHNSPTLRHYLAQRVDWTGPVQAGDPKRAVKYIRCMAFEELREATGLNRHGGELASRREDAERRGWLLRRHANQAERPFVEQHLIPSIEPSLALIELVRSSLGEGAKDRLRATRLVYAIEGDLMKQDPLADWSAASLEAEAASQRDLLCRLLDAEPELQASRASWQPLVEAAAWRPSADRIRDRWYQRQQTCFSELWKATCEAAKEQLYPSPVSWGVVAAFGDLVLDERRRARLKAQAASCLEL